MTEQMVAGAELDAAVHTALWGPIACSAGMHCSDIPPYSSDIAAAWLVVERLRQIGLSIVMGDEDDGWEIEVITNEALYAEGYRGCYVQGVTAPEVIVRAALAATDGRAGEDRA